MPKGGEWEAAHCGPGPALPPGAPRVAAAAASTSRGWSCQPHLVPRPLHCGQLWRRWCSGTSTRAPWCWPGAGPVPPRGCGHCGNLLPTPAPDRPRPRALGEKSTLCSETDGPALASGALGAGATPSCPGQEQAEQNRTSPPLPPGAAWTAPSERGPAVTRETSGWGPQGPGPSSPRGAARVALPGRARAVSPLPFAASMAPFRSCIHFSFSSRVLRGDSGGSELACRACTASQRGAGLGCLSRGSRRLSMLLGAPPAPPAAPLGGLGFSTG